MADENAVSCTFGGKNHKVDAAALQRAKDNAADDGSYTVTCLACGKQIVKGPTDLTFRGTLA